MREVSFKGFTNFTSLFLFATVMLFNTSFNSKVIMHDNSKKYALAIHGGAGTITRNSMSPEKEKAYQVSLLKALDAGETILKNNGSALDAVEAAVRVLEDDPLFNAGRGSVYNSEGKVEMDAAIMDGHTYMAGSVAGVHNIANPVSLARAVMDKTEHVMLTGAGADTFARSIGVAFVADDYFYNEFRMKQLKKAKENDTVMLDHKKGTVGAVALDRSGKLAAATSTGGMTNKKWGRVGDAPIIGSGTFANKMVAISCTGHGEFFIRSVVAYDVAALMEYKGLGLEAAANEVVMKKLVATGGEGGLIAVDHLGNITLPFNSEGMYRGMVKEGVKPEVFIYKD